MRPRSQAEARLLGQVAAGTHTRAGISQQQARDALRGVKVSRLPTQVRDPMSRYPVRKARLRKAN